MIIVMQGIINNTYTSLSLCDCYALIILILTVIISLLYIAASRNNIEVIIYIYIIWFYNDAIIIPLPTCVFVW